MMNEPVLSIAQWEVVLGTQDATYVSAEEATANAILNGLIGYRENSKFRQRDIKALANAIQAYAKMLQDAGVTVVS